MLLLTYVLRIKVVVVKNRHTDTQTAFHLCDVAAVDEGGAICDGIAGTEVEYAIGTYTRQSWMAAAGPSGYIVR